MKRATNVDLAIIYLDGGFNLTMTIYLEDNGFDLTSAIIFVYTYLISDLKSRKGGWMDFIRGIKLLYSFIAV